MKLKELFFRNSKSVYIKPSTDVEEDRNRLLKQFYQATEDNSFNFFCDLVSLNLAELGVEDGVNFNIVGNKYEDENKAVSYFYPNSNKINTHKLFTNLFYRVNGVAGIAHECFHKFQNEQIKTDKYFGKNKTPNYFKLKNIENLLAVCGLDSYYKTFYYGSKLEKEAFDREAKFVEKFLTNSKAISLEENDVKAKVFLNGQIKNFYNERFEIVERSIFYSRQFNANIDEIYEKFALAYYKLYDLLNVYEAGLQINPGQEEVESCLRDNFFEESFSHLNPVQAIVGLLGLFPEREKVEEIIDFALSSNKIAMMGKVFDNLVENTVPLTKKDFTRFVLCSENYFTKNSRFLYTKTFERIDEEFMVDTFLACYGYQGTCDFICKLKREEFDNPKFDFNKIDKIMEDSQTIQKYAEAETNCCEVLNGIVEDLVTKGQITYSQKNFVRSEISKNLASIIISFDREQYGSEEFLQAIEDFKLNPFCDTIVDSEEIDQNSRYLDDDLSKDLNKFLSLDNTSLNQRIKMELNYINNGAMYETITSEDCECK